MGEHLELVRKHHLFDGLSDRDIERLNLGSVKRSVKAGEVLIREGERGEDLYIIESGTVEVVRRGGWGDREHRIATLSAGETFGELALLDNGPRSATVRAIEDCELIVILTGDFGHRDKVLEREHAGVLRNLGFALAERMRGTNNLTVGALGRELELTQLRVAMAEFIGFMLVALSVYAFVIRWAADRVDSVVSTSVVSVPVIAGFALSVVIMMRRSGYPLSTYGLTTINWRTHTIEAVLWTLPVLVLVTLIKWLLIRNSPEFAGEPLFNFYGAMRTVDASPLVTALLLAVIYSIIVPLQELVARGALQSSLNMFLVGRYKAALAIVISNAVFTACHLHLSIGFAVLAFFPGLIWGVLYDRQKSLIGVSVSHVLIGVWAFSVLGVEAVLPV